MIDEQIQHQILDYLYEIWLKDVKLESCLRDIFKIDFDIEERQFFANTNYLVDKNLIKKPSTIRYCTKITINGIISIELKKVSIDLKKRIKILKYLREKYYENSEVSVNSSILIQNLEYNEVELERIVWYLNKIGYVTVRWYGARRFLVKITDLGLDYLNKPSKLEQESDVMANAYSSLYKLENTLRTFYELTLREHYGEEWWEKGVSGDIRKKAEKNKKLSQSKEKGDYSIIFYTDFEDLRILPNKRWKLFEEILKTQSGVLSRLGELEPIRNKIAHSRLLIDDELSTLKLFYRQIREMLS